MTKKKEPIKEPIKIPEKEVYQFIVKYQYREGLSQEKAREEILKYLRVAPIRFKLDDSKDKKKQYKKEIFEEKYTFETIEEARQLAIKVLETGIIFYCELNKVLVK